MFAEQGITLKTLWYLPNTSEPFFKSDVHFIK